MVDWSSSMTHTYEYYIVDPNTWADVKRVDTVKSCTINRDDGADTKGSATFDIVNSLGECYIRVYLITIQNGLTEKHPLGTFLVQTPSSSFDGKTRTVSMDAYTPLIELKESQPPIGYYIPKRTNILDISYQLIRENARAPVIKTGGSTISSDHFIADTSDTWLSFISDYISNHIYNSTDWVSGEQVTIEHACKYTLGLDELGRIIFLPKQDASALRPVWTYNDDNSSILYPDVSMTHDLYGIPNVVEVVYSKGSDSYYSKVVNDDPNSPTSIVARGREIPYRVTDPDLSGNPTQSQIDDYAERLLSELSTLEYTISYTHGYCPVRLGDCVRLNYERAGIKNVKAKVISQSIKCEPGCPVSEKAVFTTKLWR